MSEPQAPPRPKQTLVEEGTEFTGTMNSNCPIIVKGAVKGDLFGPSLTVSQLGSVCGAVKVEEIISDGQLEGRFEAHTIRLSGQVKDGTTVVADSLDVRLSGADKQMAVIFGDCELLIGAPPTKEQAIAQALAPPEEDSVSAAEEAEEDEEEDEDEDDVVGEEDDDDYEDDEDQDDEDQAVAAKPEATIAAAAPGDTSAGAALASTARPAGPDASWDSGKEAVSPPNGEAATAGAPADSDAARKDNKGDPAPAQAGNDGAPAAEASAPAGSSSAPASTAGASDAPQVETKASESDGKAGKGKNGDVKTSSGKKH
jgi:cytoskeletal protein CcmA (bactofilin family)